MISGAIRLVMEPKDSPRLIGYARVSTEEQNLDMQIRQLEAAGCHPIYQEKVSGAAKKRKQLSWAIRDLRPGDTLVVTQLDRLARNMRQLYQYLDDINEAGASFKSLKEQFDFTTAIGKFVLSILGLVAELERQLTVDRTKAGMAALRARGGSCGQPQKFTAESAAKAKKMMAMRKRNKQGQWVNKFSIAEIAEQLGVSVSTVHLRMRGGRHKHGRKSK